MFTSKKTSSTTNRSLKAKPRHISACYVAIHCSLCGNVLSINAGMYTSYIWSSCLLQYHATPLFHYTCNINVEKPSAWRQIMHLFHLSKLLNPPTTPTTPKVQLTQLQQATLHVMQLKPLRVPIGSTWRSGSSTWTVQKLTPKTEEN